MKATCSVLGGILIGAITLSAQPSLGVGTFEPDRGFLPFGSHSLSETESINEATGGVVFTVPMAKLPAGRAGFSMGVDLTYNSQIYDVRTVPASGNIVNNYCQNAQYNCPTLINALTPSLLGGWRYSYNYALEVEQRQPAGMCQPNQPATYYVNHVSIVLPDGSSHAMRLRGTTDNGGDEYYAYSTDGNLTCNNVGLSPASIGSVLKYYTTDGSFIQLTIDNAAGPKWTAVFSDGRSVSGIGVNPPAGTGIPLLHPANRVCDRNSNCVSIVNNAASGGPTTTLTDDEGRVVTIKYNDANCTLPADTWPNCSATTDNVTQAGYQGSAVTWNVNWTSIPVASVSAPAPYQCKSPTGSLGTQPGQTFTCLFYSTGIRVVSDITLPTGAGILKYQFQYADANAGPGQVGWGELRQVTFPGNISDAGTPRVTYQYKYQPGATQRDATTGAGNPILTKNLYYRDPLDSVPVEILKTWTYTMPGFGETESKIVGPDGTTQTNSFLGPNTCVSNSVSFRQACVTASKTAMYGQGCLERRA